MSSAVDKFREVWSRYPKYESQLYTIPGPPSIIQDDNNHRCAFGHRQVCEFLLRLKEKLPHLNTERGFKIHELPCTNQEKTTLTCLYIPRLEKNSIFGFKFVRKVQDDTAEHVSQSIFGSIKALEAILLPLQEKNLQYTKVKIKFLIFMSAKDKKKNKKSSNPESDDPIFEKIQKKVSGGAESLKTLDVSVEKIYKSIEEDVFDDSELAKLESLFSPVLLETASCSESGNATEELSTIVNSVKRLLHLTVIEDEVRFEDKPGKKDTTSETPLRLDRGGLSQFMNSHFKDWKSSLITVPFFDQIKSGLLFKTDKYSGKISSSEGADEYIGEMENFWKELICLLDSPSGLLLKSYKETHLSNVLKHPFSEEFQHDWMFLSNDQIIVFEIGRSNNLDNPVSIMQKKWIQVFTNILPKIQFIVWWFLKHLTTKMEISAELFDSLVEGFLSSHVKVFIFFPNISEEKFRDTLLKSWEEANVLEASDLSWEQLYFLVEPPRKPKELPVFLKVKKDDLSVTKLDSQQLESFLQCTSKNDSLDLSTKYPSFSSFVEYICALFAMGYFLDDGKIKSFDQEAPLPVDERFGEDQIKFLEKEKILKGKKLHQLGVTLSPQQLQILKNDRKLALLVGEPGTGKTVVLQARAFLAAQDPEVSFIYFFSPSCKTSLREKVDNFVDFSEYRETFMTKNYKFLTEEELFGLIDTSFKTLHKTVLFLDEIYFEELDYNQLVQTKASRYREKFFQLSIQVFPYLRACWMANIVAPIMRNVGKRPPEFFAGDIFNITPLSVQYRSSKHISLFSSTYLHSYNNAADTSSSRTPGCFLSSEFEVQTLEYSSKETLDFSTLEDKLGKQRWAIVFCEAGEIQQWKQFLKKCGKFSKSFVNPSDCGCHDSEFGGGETDSVVMIIDHVPTCSITSSSNEFSTRAIYSLAITRAQLSLRIYVRKEFSKLTEKFISMREWSVTQELLMKARTARPIDFSDNNLDAMKPILGQLYQISIKNEDTELMKKLMEHFPEKESPDEHPKAEALIRSLMGGFKSRKFLKSDCFKEFKKRFGEKIRDHMKNSKEQTENANDDPMGSPPSMTSIVGTLKRSIDMSCLPLLECIFGLFVCKEEEFIKESIRNFPVLMLQACFKGDSSILEFLISKLSHFRLLDGEMNRIYKVWNGETTLLTLLCHCNCNSEAIGLILGKGFPKNLYLHKFFGKNALKLAIEHNNQEVVCVLLKNPESQLMFLGPDVLYDGKTALEFAKNIGFEDLADNINKIQAKRQ